MGGLPQMLAMILLSQHHSRCPVSAILGIPWGMMYSNWHSGITWAAI